MLKRSIIMLGMIFMFAYLLKAQTDRAYLGPQLGWQKAKNADNAKFMIGGAFRAKLSKSFGLEGSINYRQEEYSNGNVQVTSYPVMVTALIYPIDILYGAIGIGWYNTSIHYSNTLPLVGSKDQSEQKFGWHFGGGVQIPLSGPEGSPNTILTADIRYVFLNYNFDNFPGSGDMKSDFYMIDVGLLFGL